MFHRDPSAEDLLCLHQYRIPTAKVRKKMSILELADAIEHGQPSSAGRIVIEHELNMRIAKEQSTATWKAAVCGAVAAILAAAIGAWLTGAFQKQESQTCVCQWSGKDEVPNKNFQEQAPPMSATKPVLSPSIQPASQAKP